jgi:hypothetical protein
MCKLLETLTLRRSHVCLHRKIYKMTEYSTRQTPLAESGRINRDTHIPAAVQCGETKLPFRVFYKNDGRCRGVEKSTERFIQSEVTIPHAVSRRLLAAKTRIHSQDS